MSSFKQKMELDLSTFQWHFLSYMRCAVHTFQRQSIARLDVCTCFIINDVSHLVDDKIMVPGINQYSRNMLCTFK